MPEESEKSVKVDVNVTSTLLERVWGSLDQATAGLTKSWRIRREGRAVADARAYEMRLIAQAESDAAAIREGRARFGDDGKLALLPPPASPPSSTGLPDERTDIVKFLTEGAARIASDEALRQTTNLLRTAAKAEDFARESDAKPSTEEVDPDWLARWRRGAQDVSNAQLQEMWARLLVKEVENPGDAPLRLINLLSLLTKKDAQLIAKLGPFTIDGGYIIEYLCPHQWETIEVFPDLKSIFPYDERFYLEELGILRNPEGPMLRAFDLDKDHKGQFFCVLVIQGRALVALSDRKTISLANRSISLTDVGRRLIGLGSFPSNEAYLEALGQRLKRLGHKVLLGDVRTEPGPPRKHTLVNEREI